MCPHVVWTPVLQVKEFDEPAHSLSLHPTGYLLLAGFADKLRLMTVLSGGRGCRAGQRRGCACMPPACALGNLPANTMHAAHIWLAGGCPFLTFCLTCRPHLPSSPRPRADDLRVIKELPIKAARDCCFSNGGQYFAAVNGNTGGHAGQGRAA